MDNSEVLVAEKCGTLGRLVHHRKDKDRNRIFSLTPNSSIASSFLKRAADALREVFLPHGYPDSVSDDYADYQIWDTVQAFCSTITGTFTTHAVLKGIGVGDAGATPLAAAFTWVLKDGMGMMGRIYFAWWKGNGLDSNCKKWRLFADILNDGAMFVELLLPHFSSYSLQVLCLTSTMKALVGVAGSATRAAITQHQAIGGNMADVSAKDGSQETCVNLIASFIGIFLLALLANDIYYYKWVAFLFFMVLHLYANYRAVCSLQMAHLNTPRFLIVLRTYLSHATVSTPLTVNQKESVVLGFGPEVKSLCGFTIKMGLPLKTALSHTLPCELLAYSEIHRTDKYLIVPDVNKKVIYVALEKGESAEDVVAAYFYSVLLGNALCIYNDIVSSNVQVKRKLHQSSPITRLTSFMKKIAKNQSGNAHMLPVPLLGEFNDFMRLEIEMFFTALRINGWNTCVHSILIDQWRADWKLHSKKTD